MLLLTLPSLLTLPLTDGVVLYELLLVFVTDGEADMVAVMEEDAVGVQDAVKLPLTLPVMLMLLLVVAITLTLELSDGVTLYELLLVPVTDGVVDTVAVSDEVAVGVQDWV